MCKLAVITLAAAALFAAPGSVSAQGIYIGPGGPGPQIYLGPGYGPQVEPRYYDEPRYYRRDREYESAYERRNYRTWNGCPRNYTVQDGVCKPYRGY
jgi:hypothetical protein